MKEFIGTCVENPFGDIATLVEITENATEIGKEGFIARCSVHPDTAADMLGFPHDFEFYKSRNVYFFTHSAIEYFYA